MGVERQIPSDLNEMYGYACTFSSKNYSRIKVLIERIADLAAEVGRLNTENTHLINDASVWRNRAINAEEELSGANRLRTSRTRADQQLQPKGESNEL